MNTYVDEAGTLHEDYTAQIEINRIKLGEIAYDSGRSDLRWQRTGYALFCRHCGEVWARLSVMNSSGEPQVYDVWPVSCKKHPDRWNIPGSILANRLIKLLDLMPEAVVRREFNLLLEQVDG